MKKDDDIKSIKGIGDKAASYYDKLGIHTVGELIEHYPRDYDEIKPIQSIAALREGDFAAVEAVFVRRPQVKKTRKLTIITATIDDGSGRTIDVTWFNMGFLLNQLRMGTKYILRGNIAKRRDRLVLEQPKIYSKEEFYNLVGRLRPIYPLTKGLTNNAVTKSVGIALEEIDDIEEYLPVSIRKSNNLIGYMKALKSIHYPDNKNELISGRSRLVFDELFLYALALRMIKKNTGTPSEYVISRSEEADEFIRNLPFELTDAQSKAYDEIVSDMGSGRVMSRLVQGDVGSGKTVVALGALMQVVVSGYQGAIMVPTEVLARQHVKTFLEMAPNLRVEVLVGSMTAKQKKDAKNRISSGECDVVIGTHALLQEDVSFKSLALVVTDEQHRFGVRQREMFSSKGSHPHILAMSATPIPRTLALILYGDMDLTVIGEKPANRLPVKNALVNTSYRPNAYKFIEKRVAAGEQVYVICPMVDQSDESELTNVTIYTEQLRDVLPTAVRIESLHGRMKPSEKDLVMKKFSEGEIDVLVSTTVVEVGIDVPNATTMLIENAERFGLATLHQLRGRVGRGDKQSYCIFMMGAESDEVRQRLQVLERSNDGFYVAGEDLKNRGQGDLFGTLQSGEKIFLLADIYEDAKILEKASAAAKGFSDEELDRLISKYPKLRDKMKYYMGDIVL